MTDHDRTTEASETAEDEGAPGASEQVLVGSGTQDAGATLAAWRADAGLTLAEIASRMKLSVRQIEAIEAGDWKVFASPSVVKGFVRAYARLVNADGDAVVAMLPRTIDPATTLSLEPTLSAPMPGSRRRGSASWWMRSGAIGVVVIGLAIAVGKFGLVPLDMNHRNEAGSSAAVSEPVAPVADMANVVPPNAGTVGAAQTATPDTPAGTAPEASVAAPAAPSVIATGSVPQLRINVENESWIEITDAAGHVLLSALQPAGVQQEVNGRAPFMVVVGNAPGVRIEYAGKPVDLTPYTRGNVARFALN